MFIDKARIFVQAGHGGNGHLSFRREKFVPMGGPNGGNGGRGGDLFLVANRHKTTLMDIASHPHYKSQDGNPGESWDRHGRYGEDLKVSVPCGTMVYRDGQFLADLREDGQIFLAAKGGRGGRGNASFKTSRNNAPRIAELGEPGESFTLDLELKVMADVGLVGCPNAGKSTLLSRITQARPKIADYPFTTLSPNLGVVKFDDRDFVVADIPGLIEGAHAGKGLGIDFLKHIERTRVLVHLVDVSGFDGESPSKNFKAIQKELALYSKKLARKPCLIVATKMDCTGAEDAFKKFKRDLKKKNVLQVSAVSGQGLPALLREIVRLLNRSPQEAEVPEPEPAVKRFVFENEFSVEKEEAGFRVRGARVEKLCAMTNFKQEEAASRFQNILKKMGVDKMLQRQGVRAGDSVIIGGMQFTYGDVPSGDDSDEDEF